MKKLLVIAGLLLAAGVSSPAEACVRAEKQVGAWNYKFINNCSFAVIVSWNCNGNCAGFSCSTNRIRPGGSDNGYCSQGNFAFRYQQWP